MDSLKISAIRSLSYVMEARLLVKLRSPIFFIILFLFSSSFYLLDTPLWWIWQLALQIILVLISFFIPSWRIPGLLLLFGLIFFNLQWFSISDKIPAACGESVDLLRGIVKSNSSKEPQSLQLIQVEIQCGKKIFNRPVAEILPSKDLYVPKSWYLAGEAIEIKNSLLSQSDILSITVLQNRFTRIYNQSRQNKILKRTPILLYVQSKASYYLQAFPAALFKAMITADRSGLSRDWKKKIRELNIAHLFAISGMHIGIIFLWLRLFFMKTLFIPGSWLGRGILLQSIDFICLFIIYCYLMIIGEPITAERAFIMLSWWFLVRYLFPYQPIWFILLGTAAAILISQPLAIAQLAFQLSFIAVGGILSILPILPKRQFMESWKSKVSKELLTLFIISLWLFLLTLPLVQMINKYHSVFSILTNVFHILFMSFGYLPLALVLFFLTLISWPFGGFAGEFYAWSLLNFQSSLWEYLLGINAKINDFFLWKWGLEFTIWQMIVYWIILFSLPPAFLYLKPKLTVKTGWFRN